MLTPLRGIIRTKLKEGCKFVDMVIGLMGEYGVLILGICLVVIFVEFLIYMNERPLRRSKRINKTVRVDEYDSMCDWIVPDEHLKSMRDSPLPPAKKEGE